jgi:hypothetical protein
MQLAFLDFFPEFLNGTPTSGDHFSLPLIHFSLIRNTQNLVATDKMRGMFPA